MADKAKAKGHAAFSAGNFEDAVRHYTDAINLAPTNHVLYSSRSTAFASLNNFSEALPDAKKTVELKPDWGKGYTRLGAAYMGLHNYTDAVSAYKKGLDIDPNNEALKSGLADAEAALARSSRPRPGASPFGDGEYSISSDPETPGRGCSTIPRPIGRDKTKKIKGKASQNSCTDEEKEKKERKALAQKEKEAVNAAYKKKYFETAIQHYSKAIEHDDEDISFLTNRAAVYLDMGKYEDCIKDCEKAVERGRELRSDYKTIARALTRKGSALVKMAKCSKDYEPAIETFQKALTKHRNPDTLKKLNDAEKAKKDLEQQDYMEMGKGNEKSGDSSKGSRNSEDGEYSILSNPETSDSGCSTIPRPIGRDKTKKKGKGKASQNSCTDDVAAEIRALRLTRKSEVEVMRQMISLGKERIKFEREKEKRKIMISNHNMLMTLMTKDRLSADDVDMKDHLMRIVYNF
ncbi:hypothetical protein ACS0TY_001387 [Phlomoides rotata]